MKLKPLSAGICMAMAIGQEVTGGKRGLSLIFGLQ